MMVMMSIRFALGRLARMVASAASRLSTHAFSEVNSQDHAWYTIRSGALPFWAQGAVRRTLFTPPTLVGLHV